MRQVRLVLYVAGGTANSSRAQHNLADAVSRVHDPARSVTIVDLI